MNICIKKLLVGSIVVAALGVQPCLGQTGHEHHQPPTDQPPPARETTVAQNTVTIPDVPLFNQDGEPIHFYRDLVQGKVVAINFIFTTCTTICPPMGANFARLQTLMKTQGLEEVALISVSTDPVVDTPERLKAWSQTFKAEPGWTLVTGPKPKVDQLLKALNVFTPDKTDHSPFILIGNEARGTWTRVHGFTPPDEILPILSEMSTAPEPEADVQGQALPAEPTPADLSPAARYFTDVTLVNQHGEDMRLYSDLLQGKIVVIHSFFSTCQGSCPVILNTVAKLQEHLGDRLGADVHLISISVDPLIDTPAKLKAHAERLQAKPGWYLLTGEKRNVDHALYKLGHYVEAKESHSNIIIIGNEPTGLWKKAMGLARTEDIMRIVDSVLNDTG